MQVAGKAPGDGDGYKSATIDEGKIRRMFVGRNDYGVGIATGRQSGLLVVDVDERNGGFETLANLLDGNRLPLDTPTVATGGGGAHFTSRSPRASRNSPSISGRE